MEKKRRRRRKKGMNPVLTIIIVILLMILLGIGIFVGSIYMAYTSEGTTGGPEVTFEIKQGEGLKVIAENLKQQGLIKN